MALVYNLIRMPRDIASAAPASFAGCVTALTTFTAFAMTAAVTPLHAAPAERAPSAAQSMQLIIPFTPGGENDGVGRVLVQGLEDVLGITVTVDNAEGGASVRGAGVLAQARPDGSTLLSMGVRLAIDAAREPPARASALKAMTVLSIYGRQPYVLVVQPAFHAISLKALLDRARANPDGLIFGSAGRGSGSHLAVELLRQLTGVAFTHVPYRGTARALNGLAKAQIELVIAAQSSALPLLRARQLTPLAVTTARRSTLLPRVPTLMESGVGDYEFTAWYALAAPARTPGAIVARLNNELARVAEDVATRTRFAELGVESTHVNSAQAAAYVQAECERWTKVVATARRDGIADLTAPPRNAAVRGNAGKAAGDGLRGAVDGYPLHELRLVVPFAPGGANDALAQILSRKLHASLGKAVVIDYRGGAGGTRGTALVAHAPPDGLTLLMNNISLAINATLFPKLPYDTVRDLAPVSIVGQQPNVVVIGPGIKANSLKALIELARARRGALIYGSGGLGSSSHLATERLQLATHVAMTHVPYSGLGPAMADLAGGKTDFIIATVSSALPGIKAGSLRALAVTTAHRTPLLPAVPTAIEAGVPGYEASTWYAILVPAGTPHAIVARLNDELAAISNSLSVKAEFAMQGMETGHTSPRDALVFLKSEIDKWRPVILASGAKPG